MAQSQPFGAPPAGQGWSAPPPGAMPAPSGAFTYQSQPVPGAPSGWQGESFGPSTQVQGPYGGPPGAYAPGFGPPVGGPGAGAPPPRPPLPRWFTLGAVVLVVLGLVLVWLTGSDWANGGVRAGIAALVVGVIVLGAFLFRFNQGYRATRTVSLAVAAILILLIVGAAGITLQGPIHSAQGSALAGQQKFADAVSEFKLANDTEGIARTYNDWGEYLLSQHKYQAPQDPAQDALDGTQPGTDGAVNKFAVVLSHYQSVSDQYARAAEGEVNAYLAWGDDSLSHSQYQDAVNIFKKAVDAKAVLGNVANFARIHQDAAKAYLGLGQQQITDGTASGDCTAAVQTYQTLATDYSDTSQGQQASTDLKKPQNIVGNVVSHATGAPAPNVKLFLSAHWQLLSMSFSASNDFTTTSDASGNFTFANIPPGDTKYLISYISSMGGESITVQGSQPANVVVVQPLCPASGGTVQQF